MFEQHPAVYEMIERVHDSLCCYRDLRARYRSRAYRAAPAVTASASPPTTASAPAAPAPPTASPPPAATVTRSESTPRSSATTAAKEETARAAAPPPPAVGAPGLDESLIVGYRMHKGRMVPVFGDADALAEKPGGADGGNGAPDKEASATPASPPPVASCPTPDPPPPAAHAAAAPRAQHPPATLSLDPPTPPAIVREVDSPIERVLAEHRALLAEQARTAEERQAAMLRDLLAEHRQSLAAAEDRHRAELAEILAQHRAELTEVSARREDDTKAIEALRELLAELAENSCEQNACLGETVANLVDAVSRIALAREKPRAPTFIPPPLRVVEAPSVTHPVADSRTDEASPATPQPPETAPAPAISQPSAPMRSSSPPANPVPPAKPAALATAPPNATATRPSPEAVTVQAPPSPATRPRTGDLTQKTTSILALVTELSLPPPTRRDLRAQEQARERQHMQELISDCEDDPEFLAECEAAVDEPDVVEAPRV